MRYRDFFPLGIASGNAFCNRTEETSLLTENIKNGKHTLLIATRRYGKSSLAMRAIHLSGLPFVETDFYMASSEKIIETYILNGVVELIGKSLGSIDKLVASIKKYVKSLKPKINISTDHFQLELQSDNESDPASNVKEALLLLEKLLAEKDKQAVFLMDEFQNVGSIAQGSGIEAAIRHVAQKTKYLTIIFSGRNRKMLQTMFEDENRPLYKLCWKLALKRISAEHYYAHIQKAAKQTWKATLNEDSISKILTLTEKHPYYLNKLCDRIWSFHEKHAPSLTEINKAWESILDEERSDAIKEISLLSSGQKNVLLQIAKEPSSQLTSKQTLLEMQMTGSSVMTALDGLEEKDVIERDGEKYQIINPVVKYYALKGSGNG
jgi:DNA-binding PadR family transcriptional regulator